MHTLDISTLEKRQIALEEETARAGIQKFHELVHNANTKGLASTTPAGVKLIKTGIEPVADAIIEFKKKVDEGTPCKRAISYKYLCLLEPETYAYLTLKAVLDGLSKTRTLTKCAMIVSGLIEDEVRFRLFEETAPALYNRITDRLGNNYSHNRKVMLHCLNKFKINTVDRWSESDKTHLGIKLLEILQETTGLIEIYQMVENGIRRYMVRATEKTLEWCKDVNGKSEMSCVNYLPMLVPPRPWLTPFTPGYLSNAVKRYNLVKSWNPCYLDEVNNADMPAVYSALNAMQGTPWVINKNVLDVIHYFWDEDREIAGLPPREDPIFPDCPIESDVSSKTLEGELKEAFIQWKQLTASLYRTLSEYRSHRLLVMNTLGVADRFSNEEAIYFPYNMDFRGRVYALPSFLSPQGTDMSKGLLLFKNGKPIEDREAAEWLAIQGANTFGYDKVSLEDRVEWVADHAQEIIACAEDPCNNLWWSQADSPWQFLAFCFEWAKFEEEGLGFVSHLPVSMDGSCNGIQHFSAMLRDPVGGASVNLIPSETPNDIYAEVADRATETLKQMASDPTNEKAHLAAKLLRYGIDRTIAKRPVMILPYGGKISSCMDYVAAELKSSHPEFLKDPDFVEAAKLAGTTIWYSIGDTVKAAREAMDWLRKVALIASKENLPITWTTPSGFTVLQAYPDLKERRVFTTLMGSTIVISLKEKNKDKLDKNKQCNGISPNFVHSMDAAALHLFVDKAYREHGIESFGMVHDSYAVLPSDASKAAKCLREVFVDMYTKHDVLNEFREEVMEMIPEEKHHLIPEVPPKGNLDINLVLESKYFFA